jgi:hypothetical protein
MAVVVCFGIFSHVSEGPKTVSRKNHYIIVGKHPCMPEKSPLEKHMANTFGKDGFPKRYHSPRKSEFTWVKTPFGEKPRNKVCIE